MVVTTAVAGFQPSPAVATSSFSTSLPFVGQRKITGRLDINMPANTALSVRLTAPSGGTSLGNVNLDVTARDLVIAVTPPFFTNVTINYIFTPTVAAGVIPASSRTVTFTVAAYP